MGSAIGSIRGENGMFQQLKPINAVLVTGWLRYHRMDMSPIEKERRKI